MKLMRATKREPKAARLNKIVLVVALLWLVTSVLLLAKYRPGSQHAGQPNNRASHHRLVLLPQAAARASFIY